MTSTVTQLRKNKITQNNNKDVSTVSADNNWSLDPTQPFPFTLDTLRKAIPPECFVPNTALSIYYWARDMFFIGCLYYFRSTIFNFSDLLFTWLFSPIPVIGVTLGSWISSIVIRVLWWNTVGFFGWCLFVVGHDCGHGTFSTLSWVREVFGHLSHSVLCVPYHGWQKSHWLHHTHHNNIDNDHTWRPIDEKDYKEFFHQEGIQGKIAYFVRFQVGMLVLYPVYLLKEDGELFSGNHFNPWSRLFDDHERFGAGVSSLCVIAWVSGLIYFLPVIQLIDYYVFPYIVFVSWLSMVTYLHHTHPSHYYYRTGSWTFLKGGLSTVDRNYTPILEHLHHDIGTHVAHHLFFNKLPHYHLKKATEGIKRVLGDYYHYDSTFFLTAMYQSMTKCKYVPDGPAVQYSNEWDKVKGK